MHAEERGEERAREDRAEKHRRRGQEFVGVGQRRSCENSRLEYPIRLCKVETVELHQPVEERGEEEELLVRLGMWNNEVRRMQPPPLYMLVRKLFVPQQFQLLQDVRHEHNRIGRLWSSSFCVRHCRRSSRPILSAIVLLPSPSTRLEVPEKLSVRSRGWFHRKNSPFF
eukprot:767910-Hanusia_phi.AAC.2